MARGADATQHFVHGPAAAGVTLEQLVAAVQAEMPAAQDALNALRTQVRHHTALHEDTYCMKTQSLNISCLRK